MRQPDDGTGGDQDFGTHLGTVGVEALDPDAPRTVGVGYGIAATRKRRDRNRTSIVGISGRNCRPERQKDFLHGDPLKGHPPTPLPRP